MAVREILLLGNPQLYEISELVQAEELGRLKFVVNDLHDTLMHFRAQYGAGRAIAAPQIGVMKRLIYMNIDRPRVFINPIIDLRSDDLMIVWDDCMSFPDLLVKVIRNKSCRIRYMNMQWQEESMIVENDLSELLQHEYDHLDGILAVSRAIDEQSFVLKSQREFIPENSDRYPDAIV